MLKNTYTQAYTHKHRRKQRMNGYQMSADAYRDYLAKKNPPGEIRADIERKITALDFMEH